MEKSLTLIYGERITVIKYKGTSSVSTGIITLLIDIIAFIVFQKWLWIILIWGFTTMFQIEKAEEINNVKSNVYSLINQGWIPHGEEDMSLLINDFKINESLIAVNFERAQVTNIN